MRKVAILAASLFAMTAPAHACLILRELKLEAAVERATVIFRGQIVNYTPGERIGPAKIAFTVEEALLGRLPDHVDVLWTNGTLATPKEWRGSKDRIVAVTARPGMDGVSQLHVIQEPCSIPFMFEDTEQSREMVRKLVRR